MRVRKRGSIVQERKTDRPFCVCVYSKALQLVRLPWTDEQGVGLLRIMTV